MKALAILIILIASSIQGLAQSSGFAITPIVKRGDPVSDGGRFFDCKECIGHVAGFQAFNNQGDVAILADVVSGSCFTNRFIISGRESIRLADFCHTTEFGKLTFLGPVNINDQRQAAINAGVTVNDRIVEMLLLYSDGQLTRIVQEGDRTPIGTIFKGCGFGQPAINNNGDVAFFACGETDEGFFFGDGVFKYSAGEITKVVVGNDPSPIGGTFALNFIPAQSVQMNNNGDVLFRAGVILDLFMPEKLGMFLMTGEGIKPIEVDGDPMPTGGIITPDTFGHGDLNDKGEVAFVAGLTGGASSSGIFLNSNGQISKIMAQGDPTPIGGVFSTQVGLPIGFTTPGINDNSAVAFAAQVTDGNARSAIFLASPKAIIKVAAVGDKLPTGGKIKEITSFALNDLGQVAFYADVKNGPKGIFLATPLQPSIKKIKLKRKDGQLELQVRGSQMITNDSVIEVNGVAVEALSYPEKFREDGGTTRRVVSRDPRLGELIGAGQMVEVTVFNPLTNLRSAAAVFTRNPAAQ
ncbi:MAG: hypothetical protein L0229_25535 [Blastocatellia bacterium]|nr:hypothetical protein [Blastocatellia bacterium]